MNNEKLIEIRGKIDLIDQEMLALLSRRATLALESGKIKKADFNRKEIYDDLREKEIIERLLSFPRKDLTDNMIFSIFTTIISACRNLQIQKNTLDKNPLTISVMGIEGSYASLAAKNILLQHNIDEYQLIYSTNSEQVVRDIIEKTALYGIVGISNTTAGFVKETLIALQNKACRMIDFITLPVKHQLLAKKGCKEIRTICSHEQALNQCQDYLKIHYPTARLETYPDTALAAKDLSIGILDSDTAVIANGICADIYQLDILSKNIMDKKDNATTFLLIDSLETKEIL